MTEQRTGARSEPDRLPEMLTVDEIAGLLRVSKTTVCRWCGSGQLQAFRLGRSWRVPREALDRFMQPNTAPASARDPLAPERGGLQPPENHVH